MISKETIESLGLPRALAVAILERFEGLLDKYDITIPDEDRDDYDEDEARLFGAAYYDLEDEITELLYEYVVELQ